MFDERIDSREDIQQRIGGLLATVKSDTGIPGLGIAVCAAGNYFEESLGVLSTDGAQAFSTNARFQLGCITKMLTCLLASSLIDEDVLDESVPICDYLEDLRECPALQGVRIPHLMSHTSGYQGLPLGDPGINYYYTWDKFREFLRTTLPLFEPGAVFNYEHTELALLGEIIHRVTGRDVTTLLIERIADPLNLTVGRLAADQQATDVAVADHAHNAVKREFTRLRSIPFGRFWSASLSDLTLSLGDLVRLGNALLEALSERGAATVFSGAAVQRLIEQRVALPYTHGVGHPEQIPVTFGYGAADYGGPLYGHNGSARGQTCGMRFDPSNRIAIAVGLNAWQPHVRDLLINRILELFSGDAQYVRPKTGSCIPMSELIGRYIGPRGVDILVTPTDRGLKASVGNDAHKQRFEVMMEQDATGAVKPYSNTLHHSIAFFKDPVGASNCIMLGLSAFRKQ